MEEWRTASALPKSAPPASHTSAQQALQSSHPEERAALPQTQDLANMTHYIAGLPRRACIDERLTSPSMNSNYLREFEMRKQPWGDKPHVRSTSASSTVSNV